MMDDLSVTLPWLPIRGKLWRIRLRYIGGAYRPKRVTDRFYEGVVHRIWIWKFLIVARYKYVDRM